MAITSPNMGLKVWNLLTDPYDHAQLADNWAKVDQHNHSSGKGLQIPTGGIVDGAISSAKISDGSITPEKIDSVLASYVGVNGADTHRDFISNSGNETTTSTSYVALATPDEVTVVLPSDGRLMISYIALWKLVGASNDGSVTLQLDGVDITTLTADAVPASIAASLAATGDNYGFVTTSATGLAVTSSPTSDSSVVATGMVSPQLVVIADAGTYTVTAKYKVNAASGGTLNVKNRMLWVKSEGGY